MHMPFLTLLQMASLELKRIRIPLLRIMSIFVSLFCMNINPLTTTSSQKKSTSVSAELLQWNRTAKHQMSQSLEAVVCMVNDLEK